VLRELRADDAPSYAAAFVDDPHLGRLIGTETDPTTEEEAAEWIAQVASRPAEGRGMVFAITDSSGEPFLGCAIVHSLDERHRRAELGIWLVPGARGRGVAKRALRLMIRWAFSALDLQRLELTTTPDNERMMETAIALGFAHEGVLRQRNLERGARVDVVWFGLLRDEWE
jgi:RimJ/RimL family protein N-acetyltransferase